MRRVLIAVGGSVVLWSSLANAQAVVAPSTEPPAPAPGVVTGASGGTPAGTNANPATAFPRSSETTGNSGLLGGQTAEQHEKFGN